MWSSPADAATLLRGSDGRCWPVDRWLRTATPLERALLRGLDGPVLDVGCGPGRHVAALAELGTPALGLDHSREVVELARSRGRAVAALDVLSDEIPRAGTWRSVLLLDGSIGIGGDPVALLRRLAAAAADHARVLVEVGAPGTGLWRGHARIEADAGAGPWSAWAHVDVAALDDIAAAAGLAVARSCQGDGRWFTTLTT